MKVNRQRISEEYNTTVDWVNDFAFNLEKNADYLSNLRSIMKKRNDFSTIEEKMADLKARAGFELVKNIKIDDKNKKSASCCEGCSKGTGGCSSCSCGKSKCSTCNKDTHNTLRNILNYIKEFSSDRPEAGYGTIISHCREHPKLGFDRVEGKIDHNKFKSLIEKILGGRENNPDEVKYMSEAEMSFEENEDIADYMAHASPG